MEEQQCHIGVVPGDVNDVSDDDDNEAGYDNDDKSVEDDGTF